MNFHTNIRPLGTQHRMESPVSPVASERVRALALRAIEGAPALTAGEMRELAEAILEHTALSDRQA